MNKTRFAGLTALDPGEPWTTDNSSFQTRNPEIIDRFLEIGSVTHRHDARAPLANPTQEVFASAISSGGQIEPDLAPTITYTLIDDTGGETLPAPAVITSTRQPMDAPSSGIVGSIDYTGGQLLFGNYYYGISFVDGIGGETAIGPFITVARDPGFASARANLSGLAVEMTAVGAAGWRLYRALGGGQFGYLASGTADTFVDNGTTEPICDIEPPDAFNQTTFFNNSLIVRVPSGAALSSAAQSFRVYIAPDGDLANGGLMAAYPMSSAGKDIVYRTLDPDATAPPDVATTIRGARKIDPDVELLDWHWKRPVASAGMLGSGATGDVRLQLSPARLRGLLHDAPAGTEADWTLLDGVTFEGDPGGTVGSAKILEFVGAGGATVVVSSGADGRAIATITASGNVTGDTGAAGPPGPAVSIGNPKTYDLRYIEFAAADGLGVDIDDLGGGSARVAYSGSGVAGTGGGAGKVSIGFPTLLNRDHVEFVSSGGVGVVVSDLGGSSAQVLIGGASASSGGALPFQTFWNQGSAPTIPSGQMVPIQWFPLASETEGLGWTVGTSITGSANSEFVVSETGMYALHMRFQFDSGNFEVQPGLRLYDVGASTVDGHTDIELDPTFTAKAPNGTAHVAVEHSLLVFLTAGQRLVPLISQNAGSSKTLSFHRFRAIKMFSRGGGAGTAGAQGPPGPAGSVAIAGSAGVGRLLNRLQIDFAGSGGVGVAVQDKGGGSAQVLVGAPPSGGGGGATLNHAEFLGSQSTPGGSDSNYGTPVALTFTLATDSLVHLFLTHEQQDIPASHTFAAFLDGVALTDAAGTAITGSNNSSGWTGYAMADHSHAAAFVSIPGGTQATAPGIGIVKVLTAGSHTLSLRCSGSTGAMQNARLLALVLAAY